MHKFAGKKKGASPRLRPALTLVAATALALWQSPAQAMFFGYDQQAEAYKHQGDAAYEAQNFPSAISYYSSAISSLPYDAYQSLAGLYYSRALANDVDGNYDRATEDFVQAKNAYDQLLQAAPSNPQANINVAWAKSTSYSLNLEINWRKTCNPNTPDYFSNINVRYWPAQKFPLRVYVDESSGRGFGSGARSYIMQAANRWVAADDRIRITEVDDINQADIIYQRPQAGEVQYGSGGQTTYNDHGDAQGRRIIDRSVVRLTCARQDYMNMTDAQKHELYNLALHESGHALGLDGHSPSGLDIMYWKSPLTQLSSRDVATIQRLYP